MVITLKKSEIRTKTGGSFTIDVHVDGVHLPAVQLTGLIKEEEPYSFNILDYESSRLLIDKPAIELFSKVESLSIHCQDQLNEFVREVFVCKDFMEKSDQNINAYFTFEMDFEHWSRPYSVFEYAKIVKKHTEIYSSTVAESVEFYQDKDMVNNHFGVVFKVRENQEPVSTQIQKLIAMFKEIDFAVNNEISQIGLSKSVNAIFQFPESIQTACEQYLIYFIQFLSDLGMGASGEIRKTATGTLFSVTPNSSNTALENIRDALDAYLKLPSTDIEVLHQSDNKDLAIMQLESNILHLKSQLALQYAIIEAKNTSIQNLQLSNFHLSTRFQPDGGEKLIVEDITVVPIRFNGIEINLPSILRRLKRKLRK